MNQSTESDSKIELLPMMIVGNVMRTRLLATVVGLAAVSDSAFGASTQLGYDDYLQKVMRTATEVCAVPEPAGQSVSFGVSANVAASLEKISKLLADAKIQSNLKGNYQNWKGIPQADIARLYTEKLKCVEFVTHDIFQHYNLKDADTGQKIRVPRHLERAVKQAYTAENNQPRTDAPIAKAVVAGDATAPVIAHNGNGDTYYISSSSMSEQEKETERANYRSKMRALANFPLTVQDSNPPTRIEQMARVKDAHKLYVLLSGFDPSIVEKNPAVREDITSYMINYTTFEREDSLFEEQLISTINQLPRARRGRSNAEIYFAAFILVLTGYTDKELMENPDIYKNFITFAEFKDVAGQLMSDPQINEISTRKINQYNIILNDAEDILKYYRSKK